MNVAALNNGQTLQTGHTTGTATPTPAGQTFSAYLSEQLSDRAGGNDETPGMTLYEAAVANQQAVGDARDANAGVQAEMAPPVLTRNSSTSSGNDNSVLMMLMMLMSGSSGDGGGMNAAMMSLLSSLGGAGIGSLLGTSGVSELALALSGQTDGVGQTIVKQAMTRLGDPYSKSKRGTGNYVDCSYLAQWAYKKAGIDIPGTAAKQAQYCFENGYEISKDELQPGDLIFWTKHSSNAGRWRNIHHVAMYAGNGKIVEAKNARNGVEVADLWGQEGNGGDWEIVMYARPR